MAKKAMRFGRPIRLGLIAVLTIGILACGVRRADTTNTTNTLFAAVAQQVPEFGGMYVDEEKDILYVYLRHETPGTVAALVAVLRAVFGDESLPQGGVEVLPARFSLLELKQWYDALAVQVLGLPGVVLTSIDHAQNQLVIGVQDSQVQALVEQQLDTLGVPREAVNFIEAGPIQLNIGLSDERRPVVGGLQIGHANADDPTRTVGICTLGFIAMRRGVRGFVTNSHCSTFQGFTDGTEYRQPDGGGRIGAETVDPRFQPTCVCFFGLCTAFCRQSDSNFSTLAPSVSADQGFIARPVRTEGIISTAWDGVSTFRIVSKARVPIVGRQVTKVGATTGRTEGTVRLSSVTVPLLERPAGGVLESQVVATYIAAGGDSGSPVIRGWFLRDQQDGNPVNTSLEGIHWGTLPTRDFGLLGLFSPISGVEADLGPLAVSPPEPDLVPLDAQGNSPPSVPVRWCKRDSQGRLVVTVENQGEAFAPAFFTQVRFSPGGLREVPSSGLSPGETRDLVFLIPAECFNPNCEFLIEVDSDDSVDEGINEGNNFASGICPG